MLCPKDTLFLELKLGLGRGRNKLEVPGARVRLKKFCGEKFHEVPLLRSLEFICFFPIFDLFFEFMRYSSVLSMDLLFA